VPISPLLAGQYEMDREVGRGGMATVYRARDTRHARWVAVKVMHPELAASLGADRFLREIRIAASLSHPHILPLFDSGVTDGMLYYVMPFVEGESLRDRLRRDRQLPVDEALHLAREVAGALGHAHSLGIVHRDVKPENILLAGGHALVADFGIARAVDEAGGAGITGSGMAIGTPAYMSPEQAAADPAVDARSDQYGLACVLYEMLGGEPPYAGATPQAMLARRLTDPVPSLRALRDTVTETVETAVRRALARSPADRFATMTAFAEALSRSEAEQAPPRSIAVLPFANLSTDPENEYFADGITEDVITQLAKIKALQVISRTSVMQFKGHQLSLRDIAARLQVASLLEGSVRRAGNRVRIVAQLIDARTDQHLWAETYDRELTDIFAIQSDVALRIAGSLRAELSTEEQTRIVRPPTDDVQAYQLYLKGRQWLIRFDQPGVRRSLEFFGKAVERDPDYAVAWAAIAMACIELAEIGGTGPGEGQEQAIAAAERALAIDPGLSEAHCMRAWARMVYEYDWQGAEAGLRRALELSPSNADACNIYGRFCASLERFDEAVALQQRSLTLDPMTHRSDLATAYLRAGKLDQALEIATRALEVSPEYSRGHATRGWALLKLGRPAEGLEALERAVALSPGDTMWLAQLAQALALTGATARAREIADRLEDESQRRYVSPYHLAYVYTGLGELDRAMDFLDQACEQHAGGLTGLKGSFLFTPLHSHPRFQTLLRRMNLA